jgi:hypothetical protein
MMARGALLAGALLSAEALQAAPVVLETGDRFFPTPAARWEFAATPFALRQVTEVGSGHAFLARPASVRFRDGKTAEVLTPSRESIQSQDGVLTVRQEFATPPLRAEQRLSVRDDTLVWEVILTHDSPQELWIEPTLRLPVAASPTARYWDGREDRAAAAAPFVRDEFSNTFPVSLLADGGSGLAVGVPPTVETSFLQNGIDQDGHVFYGTRLVVAPGRPAGITFLLYLVKPSFGARDAVHGYCRRFPASFEPTPGVDPRLVDGRRTDTLQICHYGGGIKDARTAVLASQYYGGYEWGYTPFKREGDYVGRKEYWDMDLTEGERKRLDEATANGTWDRSDWERFHQTRAARFRDADRRGNTVLAFYLVNHVDKALAERLGMADYAFPRTTTAGLIEKNWVLPYGTVYYFYPWATPYETILRRDLPEVVQELNLYAFAHDLYGEPTDYTRYRKKLDYPLPGWSYDEEGPFISQGLGYRHQADFIHTLKKGDRTVGLIVNGMTGAHPLCFFAADAFISESRMTVALTPEDRDRYIHCRLFAGHKPVYQHGYASGILLGDTVPWETLTPEQCRAVYDDFVRDYLIYLYQAGLTPSRHLSEVHEVISKELPVLLEVMSRGFEPAPGCLGAPELERVRYGAGLGAAVVLSNRTSRAMPTAERLLSRYLAETGSVVPAEGRGGELAFRVDGTATVFPLTVVPMENRIVTFPVAIRSAKPLQGNGRCVAEVEPLRRVYRITLDLAAPTEARIAVAPDPGFTVAQVTCGGTTLAEGDTARLAAGTNTLVVETVSALFHAPVSALTGFPFGDATVVLPEKPDEREQAAAQMLQDFVEVRLKKNLRVGMPISAAKPVIRIVRPPQGQRRGVTVEGNSLTALGTDPFDTQQITWDLLRFLDRYDPRFVPTGAVLYAGGDASTTKMLEKAELMKQWVREVKTEKRLAWNGFPKPERPAQTAVVRPEDLRVIAVPRLDGVPVMDGKLDDEVWRSAAVADGFTVLGKADTRPTQPTEARVFRTRNTLFVGFTCHEANMDKVLAQMKERDSPVWNDDVFELRLAPGVAPTAAKYPYYIFLVNSIGTRTDLQKGGTEMAWNADWAGAVHRDATFWSGELRIPLAALAGSVANVWRANFSRFEKPNAEYSTWSPIPEHLADQPPRFGIMNLP